MKKTLSILLALVMVLSLCTVAFADDTVTLRVSVIPGSVSQGMQLVADAYMAANPNVNIELIEFEESTYQDQMLRILSAKDNGLDVAWHYRSYFWDEMAEGGYFLPLNDVYEKQDIVKGLGEATANLLKKGDNYYSILFTNVWIGNLYYNKSLMEANGWEVPTTWDELFDLATKAKDAGLIPIAGAAAGSYAEHHLIPLTYRCFDSTAYAEICNPTENSISFTDDRWVKAFDELQKVTTELYQDGVTAADSSIARGLFLQGKSLMLNEGSWAVGQLNSEKPEGFEYGYFSWPAISDDIPAGVATYPGNVVSALSISDNPDVATDFVGYCCSVEAQSLIAESGIDAPARSDCTAEAMEDMGSIFAEMYNTISDGSAAMWTILYNTEFVNVMNNEAINGVMNAALTSEEACALLQETYESIYG